MGCAASKNAVSVTPAADSSGILRPGSEPATASSSRSVRRLKKDESDRSESGESGKAGAGGSRSYRLSNLHRYIEGEQVAAGWPPWLSAVAGEAIQGWVPLKAESFEKLEKIGQGTYSSVFRAQDLETGKIVALKKVRFDNFEPESVRFMAREIQILRRLQHPNVVKLEGLITSRLSCSIYLVFEYMEHDLAGLSSSPDIKFSESQIKCYMNQLLSGLEHCHSRGIIHRDIKGANLLVNNEGILKIADFGLANFSNPRNKQPLTSRVVTLWYRPPELLLGSTEYGATVDLWSVGCVFAEMFLGKPILQGRTEVEQLHKIFKLCGSPADEYWKTSKLPHATIFKPHHPYDSCLEATFKLLPESAFNLLETLLSVEPHKRGTASSALSSEYFRTKPFACEPSSLPKYSPNKEIDAKSREEAHRKRVTGRVRGSEAIRKPTRSSRSSQESNVLNTIPTLPKESQTSSHGVKAGGNVDLPPVDGKTRLVLDPQPVATISHQHEAQQRKHSSHRDVPFSGPLHVTASSGFAWVKRQNEDRPYAKSLNNSISRSRIPIALQPSDTSQAKNISNLRGQANGNHVQEVAADSKGAKPVARSWTQVKRTDTFDYTDAYHSQKMSEAVCLADEVSSKLNVMGYQDQGNKVDFSGPLLSQSHKVDELLSRNERHIRQAVRKSWFQRGRRQVK